MEEKKQILRNEQRVRNDTLQFRTAADLGLENTGRYAKPFTVIGTEPTPHYPKLPTSSPWHDDPVPPEEPLGYSVDETPIVGEVEEVQASIDRLEAAAPAEVSVPHHSPDAVAESATGDAAPTQSSDDFPRALSEALAASPNKSPATKTDARRKPR